MSVASVASAAAASAANNSINYNTYLGRDTIYNNLRDFLASFQKNKSDLTFKRGVYIYGAPGAGKTELNNVVKVALESLR